MTTKNENDKLQSTQAMIASFDGQPNELALLKTFLAFCSTTFPMGMLLVYKRIEELDPIYHRAFVAGESISLTA